MQTCNKIYYSTVHQRLTMFRAAHCSSSGALTVFAASGLRTHVVTGRSQGWIVRLDYGRSPHAYVNQRLQIQLELLMMSSVQLETWWAFDELWNNKFYYKFASCWLFLLSHTTMHGSMNIKNKFNSIHYSVTNTRFCIYSCLRSWWWVVVPLETCRAVSK
jgi:hypothetical protein